MHRRLLTCAALLALAACQREAQLPQTATVSGVPTPAPAPAQPVAIELEDVIETSDRYIIGITYPPSTDRYPQLAQALKRYADAARSDVMQALEAGGADARTPYDLSLNFVELHASPQLVVIAADGSSYTGGAHGTPLVQRFVWLPAQQEMLTVGMLLPEAGALRAISDYVREQLHGALSQRADAEDLAPEVHAEMIENGNDMIDQGTTPEPGNFDLFEPVFGTGSRIAALRFVFPPYQVGPYSDGTQTVDVPAQVLLPYVAPAYRDLFAGQLTGAY